MISLHAFESQMTNPREISTVENAIHLVRGAGDLKAAMPRFVTAFIEAQMSTQQEGRHPS